MREKTIRQAGTALIATRLHHICGGAYAMGRVLANRVLCSEQTSSTEKGSLWRKQYHNLTRPKKKVRVREERSLGPFSAGPSSSPILGPPSTTSPVFSMAMSGVSPVFLSS